MNSAQQSSGSGTVHVPNLLLVEDSQDDVLITQRALARAHIGNNLTVASDGQQALDLLYADAMDGRERFGLILLDLGLPKVDGREVLTKIWGDRRLRHIPVIVLTGSDEDEDMVRSYKSGAVAYLRKPVQVDQLLRAVGDLHGYRLLIARTSE
ncbi:MAG: response regulator [Deltaproteobacteria bacterium]|nr:response regulator [Deltaproteobacteria bacterium]